MPSRVRIISPRNSRAWDELIAACITQKLHGHEQTYYGITSEERADRIRRALRTAGRHQDPAVAVRAYWRECTGCNDGGQGCRYHVNFTVYDMSSARAYKERAARTAR